MTGNLFSPRPYQGESDLAAMQRVLTAGRQPWRPSAFYIHPGDLNWWLLYLPLGNKLPENIAVWDDPAAPGELLGWSLVDPFNPSFDVFVQPGLLGSDTARQMYLWAEQRAFTLSRKNTMYKYWVAETDAFQRAHLEGRGYQAAGWDICLSRSLVETVPESEYPEEYSIRRCGGVSEVAARAAAQHAAFESSKPLDQYTAHMASFMSTPAYRQALDIVAVDPNGKIGAFCIAWLDPVSTWGHIEPLGAHPDFQRRGLGRAVLLAALRQMQIKGMSWVSITTSEENQPAIALYQSTGCRPSQRLGIFKLA